MNSGPSWMNEHCGNPHCSWGADSNCHNPEHEHNKEKKMSKPKVVVMCGSSRFVDIMAVCEWLIERDELAITMGLNLLPHWYNAPPDHLAEAEGCATQMDDLHLCKIDMADEIFVVDWHVDGVPYIGNSTAREIAHAQSKGVHVRRISESPFIRDAIGDLLLNTLKHDE